MLGLCENAIEVTILVRPLTILARPGVSLGLCRGEFFFFFESLASENLDFFLQPSRIWDDKAKSWDDHPKQSRFMHMPEI